MPTICPNCLRPVRSGAKFCGYCGTNLNPAAADEIATTLPSLKGREAPKVKSTHSAQPATRSSKVRRAILIIVIVLLCLVLLMAFLIHYWPVLSLFAGSIISILFPR